MSKQAVPSWNLSDLYPGIAAKEVAVDIAKAERAVAAFNKRYQGKVEKFDAKTLAVSLKEYEKLQDLLGRLISYAQLFYAQNMSDAKGAQFYQNVQEKINTLSTQLLFFGLSLNKIPDAAMQKLLRAPEVVKYAPWLRDVRTMKPYQLADDVEKLLHEKDVSGRMAWVRLYDETSAALRFPMNGKQLTSSDILNLMSSPKAETRKKAGKSFAGVLSDNARIFAMVTNTLAKDKEIEDNWRGFAQPIASRNIANYVEDEVVEALISTVKKNYPRLSHRYYSLKAKWLGQKKMHYTDRNAPLPGDREKKYSWDEARDLVLSAYHAFSPPMAKLAKQFFDKRWIDAAPREGKDSGAFSHGTVPSAHPYILMNYLGKPRDVMTLAHELGHGVHQCLSAKQGALMADTPLTLAETASVFGEQLTFQEMLRQEKNAEHKKYLIAHKVEDMLNTVVRQIAFCEFEKKVHAERRLGELSTGRIGEIWMSVQSESLGPAFKFDKEYAAYWSYISHFIHAPFYVYAYAFGDCLVNSLYAVYQQATSKGKAREFEQKYIAMLTAGGTLRHKELLKPFGLDASRPTFWQQGLDVISGYIDELERLG